VRRPEPESKVVAFVAARPLEQLYASAVTFVEIRSGIELVTEPGRRAALNGWLTHKVRPMFDGRVLPVTGDIMLQWRLLVDRSEPITA
jgi:predicted nucleic acid-binding protein